MRILALINMVSSSNTVAFRATILAWLNGLNGLKGFKGFKGFRGLKGLKGLSGFKGHKASRGHRGFVSMAAWRLPNTGALKPC